MAVAHNYRKNITQEVSHADLASPPQEGMLVEEVKTMNPSAVFNVPENLRVLPQNKLLETPKTEDTP